MGPLLFLRVKIHWKQLVYRRPKSICTRGCTTQEALMRYIFLESPRIFVRFRSRVVIDSPILTVCGWSPCIGTVITNRIFSQGQRISTQRGVPSSPPQVISHQLGRDWLEGSENTIYSSQEVEVTCYYNNNAKENNCNHYQVAVTTTDSVVTLCTRRYDHISQLPKYSN